MDKWLWMEKCISGTCLFQMYFLGCFSQVFCHQLKCSSNLLFQYSNPGCNFILLLLLSLLRLSPFMIFIHQFCSLMIMAAQYSLVQNWITRIGLHNFGQFVCISTWLHYRYSQSSNFHIWHHLRSSSRVNFSSYHAILFAHWHFMKKWFGLQLWLKLLGFGFKYELQFSWKKE